MCVLQCIQNSVNLPLCMLLVGGVILGWPAVFTFPGPNPPVGGSITQRLKTTLLLLMDYKENYFVSTKILCSLLQIFCHLVVSLFELQISYYRVVSKTKPFLEETWKLSLQSR